MQSIEVTLRDDVVQTLELEAARRGWELDTLLVRTIEQRLAEFLPGAPEEWMPREQWEALVSGDTCPLCREMTSDEYANDYGYTIADLSLSRLRLSANQSVPGYCILFCKKHVQEPYHLSKEERGLYVEDLMQAAQAIERVFNPVKMNFEILGNVIPHLHCHIKPRFYGDAAPGAPIHPDKNRVMLTGAEYDERVKLLREALQRTER